MSSEPNSVSPIVSAAPALSGFTPDQAVCALGSGVQVYVVGGAVRDELMGAASYDNDWVVVGATPELMISAGFKPVGVDFPVFLHPHTHDEYALARTERKTAPGYKGFVFHADPTVTLQEDLARRDLTINAMGKDQYGVVYDPWGGYADLQAKILRHVGPAFGEDPVRILRLGRFAARFGAFSVAPDTMALCQQMVRDGEADALVPERVWQEVARGLMAPEPYRMMQVLRESGVWGTVTHGLGQAWVEHLSTRLDELLETGHDVTQRWAIWCLWADLAMGSNGSDGISTAHPRIADVLKLPTEVRDLGRLVLQFSGPIAAAASPAAVLACLEGCDALRKPVRWRQLLAVVAGQLSLSISRTQWDQALQAINNCDMGYVVEQAQQAGLPVREAVGRARLAAVAGVLVG